MNNKCKNIITTFLFSSFLILGLILNITSADKEISISERRKLKQFPEISLKNISSGKFFQDFEEYASDQFINREDFRKIKVNIELKVKGNYNNLYLYNDYIIEQSYPLNENSVNNFTKKINTIKNMYLNNSNNIYYTIVPDKNYFIDDGNLKYDYNKLVELVNNNLNNLTYINIFNDLSLDDYYKTDTHWREDKIIDIAKKITEEMGNNFINDYTKEKITTFSGVYKGRLPVNLEKDEIVILNNNIINNSKVMNYQTKKYEQVYNMNKINSLDKYDIYLSGSTPLLTITGNENSNKDLIVFRDSYGSSLIPLLLNNYRKIDVIDTRYISPKILDQYIDFDNKDILFIYSTLLINNSTTLR